MIGVDARPSDPLLTMSSRYNASSALGSATVRAGCDLPWTSSPPMLAFSATNCAGVIAPDFSAVSPYWRPMLSSAVRTNPVFGSRPSWLTICSVDWHLTPFGFVVGFQRTATGIDESQLSVAVARLANDRFHAVQLLKLMKSEIEVS